MDKKEKIVSPAVLCEFEHWEMYNRFNQIIMCVHYDDGIVNDIRNAFINENTDFISSTDGFMTSAGRFVNPKEAMKIAVDNIQVKELFDLWIKFNENDLLFDRVTIDNFEESKDKYFDKIDELLMRDLKPEDLY